MYYYILWHYRNSIWSHEPHIVSVLTIKHLYFLKQNVWSPVLTFDAIAGVRDNSYTS